MSDEEQEAAASSRSKRANRGSRAKTEALANGAEESAEAVPADEAQPPRRAKASRPSRSRRRVDRTRGKAVLESLIFVSERTVTAVQLGRAAKIKAALVRELVAELMLEYAGRGIELIEVAGGYQFRSAPACAAVRARVRGAEAGAADPAQLETLALIAYRQPMTRPEIDDVRGVDSGSAMRVLLERNLIKMLGRKDEPGRPLLYGTSSYFLEFFGMRSLKDLPTLREFTELSEENRALFKRKTGEAVEDAEAALFAEPEPVRRRAGRAHLGRGLAELAAKRTRTPRPTPSPRPTPKSRASPLRTTITARANASTEA